MGRKIFVNVVANVILVAIILAVALVVFGGGTASVFNKNEYAPIYRGGGKNCVSLMINVYWGNEYLVDMLKVLQQYDVKCTFFVGGSWVAKYPELLQSIVDGGHEIGNHGYFHKQHSKLTYQQNCDEIVSCNKIVFSQIGVRPTLFMAPSGDFGQNTLQASNHCGMQMIMWSRDTIDWRDQDEQVIFERCTKNIKSGELILMHPTQATQMVLERVLKYYMDAGLKVVAVSQNISK